MVAFLGKLSLFDRHLTASTHTNHCMIIQWVILYNPEALQASTGLESTISSLKSASFVKAERGQRHHPSTWLRLCYWLGLNRRRQLLRLSRPTKEGHVWGLPDIELTALIMDVLTDIQSRRVWGLGVGVWGLGFTCKILYTDIRDDAVVWHVLNISRWFHLQ